MVSKEILEARAILMSIRGESIRELNAYIRKYGPIATVAAIRDGSAPDALMAELATRELPEDELLANLGDGRLIVPESPEWPTERFSLLRLLNLEPLGLVVLGDESLAALTARTVAVVGTDDASVRGVHNAAAFSLYLSVRDMHIVTRAHVGINERAFRTALHHAGVPILVLADGFDKLQHLRGLEQEAMTLGGVLVTEYLPGTTTLSDEVRHKSSETLVAALARALVVIETTVTSMGYTIAHTASEFGRPVFAVPAQAPPTLPAGTNALIREGIAVLVDHPLQVTTEHTSEEAYLIRPEDPMSDLWGFRRWEDAERLQPLCSPSGDIECVPISDPAKAAWLVAEELRRLAEDEDELQPDYYGSLEVTQA